MKINIRGHRESGFSFIFVIVLIVSISLIGVGLFTGKKLLVKSRAKDIVRWCRKWESAQLTYYFKRDKLAGDTNGNGVIDDEGHPVSPIRALVKSKVINESKMKIEAGDSIFHIKIGYDTTRGIKRNVFVICPSSACERPLEGEEIMLMEMIDGIMDGETVVAEGDLRGVEGVSLVAEGEGVTDVREAVAETSWSESAFVGAVYYFEDYQH